MKLCLHNILKENQTGDYPMRIIATKQRTVDVEFDNEACKRLLESIDLGVLEGACNDIGLEPPDRGDLSDSALRKLHHILFEVEVLEGYLMTPGGNCYSIKGGIPDLTTTVKPPQ